MALEEDRVVAGALAGEAQVGVAHRDQPDARIVAGARGRGAHLRAELGEAFFADRAEELLAALRSGGRGRSG